MDLEWQREHLWLYLLALGFDPELAEENLDSDLSLGVAMFDAPNSNAFRAVALFLFSKLDKQRAEETFRDCWLPERVIPASEFGKRCNSWLKDIASEDESCLPQVATSLFVSPAGRRFIDLMYQFARHIVVENLRESSAGSGKPVVEDVNLSPEDMYKANARCSVACNELLQILQKKDFIMRKYRTKSQLLISKIKRMKSEYADLQQQLWKMKHNDQNKNDKAERIQKVRNMWTFIMETLTSLKKEKEIVDYVLEGHAEKYTLDGTNVVVSIPRLLADEVESEMEEVCTGSLYEAEKLNFLTVIQLLNEALRILKDECRPFESKKHFQPLVNAIKYYDKIILGLEAVRQKIKMQHCTLSESSSGRQREWRRKWKSQVGWCPVCLINSQNSDADLTEAMSCHCPSSAEEHCTYDSICEEIYQKDDETLESIMDDSTLTPTRWMSSLSSELPETSESRHLLSEKDLDIEAWNEKEKPVSPEVLKDGKDELTISELWIDTDDHVTQTESPVKKEDPLYKAREELAEKVVKTVISESPQSGEGKGMALEDLISSLTFNPFLTRKQIPRTPENLLTEIRISWRKAVQTEDLSDIDLAAAEETTEESPVDASPAIQNKAVAGLVWSTSSSESGSPSSERKSQGSSAEFAARKQMKISHVSESLAWETPGMLESDRSEEQELNDIVFSKSSKEKTEEPICLYVEKSINNPNIFSENSSKINTLPSDHWLGSLADGDLQWDAPSVSSSDSCKGAEFGILHETLPTDCDSIGRIRSTSLESDLDYLDSIYLPDNTTKKVDIQKLKLDLESLLTRYEILKKSSSGTGEELHQMPVGDESLSCISDLSLAPEEGEGDDLGTSLDLFRLDEEFSKTPSPISLPERPLPLVFPQDLEEMASNIQNSP